MDRAHISRLRRLAAVRSIARAWRDLIPQTRNSPNAPQRTLLACSGGADSCALVLALAAAASATQRAQRLIVAHIIHDLRASDLARSDADRARALAAFVGVECVVAEVHPALHAATETKRNLEALARRERYAALADLAREHNCDAIATAHHAGDQAETVLMRLLRGTGIDGLRAIHPACDLPPRAASTSDPSTSNTSNTSNSDAPRVRLIRPMLAVTRADAEEICTLAGWQWGVDHTNADTSRTRAWIRHDVLPMLESRAPGATQRLASTAAHAQSAHQALHQHARELWQASRISRDEPAITLDRAILRDAPTHIASMVLRRAIRSASARTKMDRVNAHAMARAVALIQDRVGGERRIHLAGASLYITRDHVRITPHTAATTPPASTRQESTSNPSKEST
jgi:tRNA(Ile)-lysidine synthetase-like protein